MVYAGIMGRGDGDGERRNRIKLYGNCIAYNHVPPALPAKCLFTFSRKMLVVWLCFTFPLKIPNKHTHTQQSEEY